MSITKHANSARTLAAVVAVAVTMGAGATIAGSLGTIQATDDSEYNSPEVSAIADEGEAVSSPDARPADDLADPRGHASTGSGGGRDGVSSGHDWRSLAEYWSIRHSSDTDYLNCRLLIEDRFINALALDGVTGANSWLEPNGERVAERSADGAEAGSIDLDRLAATADGVVLATLDDDNSVIRSEVDQAAVARAIEPCLDPTTALETILASELVDLHSIYLESTPSDRGVDVVLRVETSQYSSDDFAGSFTGSVPSPGFDSFLSDMPAGVREQVVERVDASLEATG